MFRWGGPGTALSVGNTEQRLIILECARTIFMAVWGQTTLKTDKFAWLVHCPCSYSLKSITCHNSPKREEQNLFRRKSGHIWVCRRYAVLLAKHLPQWWYPGKERCSKELAYMPSFFVYYKSDYTSLLKQFTMLIRDEIQDCLSV